MEPTKPDDHIYEDIPLGPAAAQVSGGSKTRVTHITKNAIQSYLQQYFSDSGKFRYQIQQMAPYVVQFETELSGTARKEDPTIFEMQVARVWQNIRQKLPCILIIDTAFKYNSTGLGGIVAGHDLGPFQGIGVQVDATLTINLEIAAKDETTAGDLRDVLALIFGTLTPYNRSHYLEPEQGSWVVRLPLVFDTEGLNRRSIPSDNMESYWSTNVTLQVDFEGVGTLATENPNKVLERSVHVPVLDDEDMELVAPSVTLNVRVPDQLTLGFNSKIWTTAVPFGSRFVSDNPNLVYIQGDLMVPRALGMCHVLLLDSLGKLLHRFPVTVSA